MLAVICTGTQEAEALDITILTGLKLDDPLVQGAHWALPMVHPEDGRVALMVNETVVKYLNDDTKNRVETLTDDWFPTEIVLD